MNAMADPATDPRISVVVLTYNRADELDRTLRHLTALPERPHLIVVDNASRDGTAEHVRSAFPAVELVRCAVNRGAAARNDGVARVRTPYVAFCDDDTWWEPGALRRAADVLDAHPRVALISGCVLVGPENRLDPACERMANSPLDSSGLPGPALVAYMAGAAVMRADAFREVGGYEERFFLGAEEALVAMDLLARRWHMVYRADVVTHHHPSPARAQTERQVMHVRNRLWVAWLRLSPRNAWRETRVVLRDAARGGVLAPVLRGALAGLPWALRQRRVLPPHVQEMRERVFAPAAGRRGG